MPASPTRFCAAFCLAAGACAAAWAQPAPPQPNVVQAPPAANTPNTQPQVQPPSAPTIKRWVDERGVTHYGDTLPPQPVRDVTELPEAEQPSAADLERGQSDLARYRQQMQPPPAPAPASTASAPAAPQPAQPSGKLTCAQQWARYDAAYACMDPYRLARGGIRPEAFKKCPVVTEPGCAR